MARFAWLLIVIAACGRSNFDDAGNDTAGDTAGSSASNLPPGDHDGDGVDNRVDNCPQAFNQTQSDGDGDGVGDACDPRPTATGDKLVAIGLFSAGFGDWAPDSITNWTIADGFATNTASDFDTTNVRLSLTATAPQPTVQLSFIVRDYAANNFDGVRMQIAAADTYECTLRRLGSVIDSMLVHRIGDSGGGTAITVASIAVGSTALTTFTRDADKATCKTDGVPLGEAWYAAPVGSATVTLESSELQASFSYAAVYGVF